MTKKVKLIRDVVYWADEGPEGIFKLPKGSEQVLELSQAECEENGVRIVDPEGLLDEGILLFPFEYSVVD